MRQLGQFKKVVKEAIKGGWLRGRLSYLSKVRSNTLK